MINLGTFPGIVSRRVLSFSSEGIESNNARVYGCFGLTNISSVGPDSTTLPP